MSQGDFNGDGLLDFVFYDRPTRSLKIAVNEGNGNFTFSYSDKIDFDLSVSNNCTMMVCDIDRDGMSDVMIANNYSNRIKTQFLYSDGARLRLKRTYDVANNSSGNRVGLSVFMGDFDGDGAEEVANVGVMLTFDGSMSRNMIYSYRPQGKAYEKSRVINITVWLGKGVRFRYSSLSSPSVYSKDASSYPVNSYSIPLSVVSRMEERNCGYASATTTYCYNTLRYHVAGRGLIGFNSVTKANNVTDIKQIMKVSSWDNLWYIPLVIQNTSIVGGDSVTTVITNNVHDINRKNYFSYPLTEETVDMYGNKSRTSYDYDVTTGLLQSQKTIFDDDEGMFKSVSYSDYTCLENKWLPRTIINTWKHSDDNDVFTGKTTLVYDSNGNTISKTVNDGTALALTSTNTYDSRGNILSTVNAGSGVVPVTKHFEYDDNGRFMTCTYSSPATAVKRYVYDKWGNILAEIDETDPDNKLIHSMSYDGWGKKTSDTAPDGTCTSYEYGWGETDEFRSYVVSKKGDVTFETRWYDCLGRERLVKSPTGIGDVETATRTYYDKCGKVCRIESFNGCLVLNKTYAYDKKGRVIEMKNAGRTETYEYGNRECITTVNGKTYKNVTDAWGNLIYAEDPLSSVEYRYYSNGKPSSITTDGCSVEVKYDAAGNKIQLTDPDAGTSTFSYAADGTLLSQTDARGVNANYEFDNTGRTLKVTTGDYTVTNTYGTGGYALQRIQRRSDGNNHIDYTYDEYGRVVRESRTVYGQGVFDYEFFYDSNGRVSKSIYPGGLEVTYEYD
ncbi:MAG: FG-GAP-like repeat-containing protein, partial [Muribaculaceae bacterium]|nr:FG-GAP-like repeat-containing protein [Muribaculaceae bacterium]